MMHNKEAGIIALPKILDDRGNHLFIKKITETKGTYRVYDCICCEARKSNSFDVILDNDKIKNHTHNQVLLWVV